jgi:pyridoxamine 5'-phosphate oxidase
MAKSHEPFDLFDLWYREAQADAVIPDASAVNLATASPDGVPSSRTVLLKGHDRRGFVIYTNLASRKGRELAANPRAALCFHWAPLRRQVRIEGAAEPVDPAEADRYFAGRPLDSRIGAWASRQSEPLESRAVLLGRVAAHAARFASQPVARPRFWSGIRVVPRRFEFWTGQAHRLHDRVAYTRAEAGEWRRGLLYP